MKMIKKGDNMIQEKLKEVQSRLNVPKNQVNKFGGYNYRSCEDILEAAKPILADVGAALIVGDELVLIGDRYYIKATARFIDTDDGSELTNTAFAREQEDKKGMDASQITGAASSYARKYALNGLFCLDDVKDADTMDNSKGADTAMKRKARQAQANIPDEPEDLATWDTPGLDDIKVKTLKDKITLKGVSEKSMLNYYEVKDFKDMSINQYKDCMDRLDKYKDKEEKK